MKTQNRSKVLINSMKEVNDSYGLEQDNKFSRAKERILYSENTLSSQKLYAVSQSKKFSQTLFL